MSGRPQRVLMGATRGAGSPRCYSAGCSDTPRHWRSGVHIGHWLDVGLPTEQACPARGTLSAAPAQPRTLESPWQAVAAHLRNCLSNRHAAACAGRLGHQHPAAVGGAVAEVVPRGRIPPSEHALAGGVEGHVWTCALTSLMRGRKLWGGGDWSIISRLRIQSSCLLCGLSLPGFCSAYCLNDITYLQQNRDQRTKIGACRHRSAMLVSCKTSHRASSSCPLLEKNSAATAK